MQQDSLLKQVNALKPWISFHGWIFIILGAFYCLSIIGAILGVPLIIAGTSLISAGSDLKQFAQSSNADDLIAALKDQKRFFMISGLIFLLSVILPFLIGISLFLAVFFNPQLSSEIDHEFNDLMEHVPQIQKQIPYDFGKGKEV